MPVIIRVTVTGRCWKQHCCVACGSVFRYLFERTGCAGGSPGDDVNGAAEQKLARALYEECDECACPGCGTIQPDMVAKGKVTWHLTLTLIAVALAFIVVIPTFAGVLPLDVAGKVCAAIAGFTALVHLATALGNPNRNRSRNLMRVQANVAAGTLQIIHGGHEVDPNAVPRSLTLLHVFALLALLVAPLGFLAVVGVSEQYPLPRNAGLKPDVVGSGDEVTIPLTCSLKSYGGYWRGASPTATVVNAAELGTPANLPAASHKPHWGKVLTVSDGKHPFEPIKPWIRVKLPEGADLGGKTIRLKMALAVTYPTTGGTTNHSEKTDTVEKEIAIELAEAGADGLYKQAWNIGKWVGLGGCLLGGWTLFMLGQHLKRRAHPHEAFSLSAPSDGRVISGGSGYAIGGLR